MIYLLDTINSCVKVVVSQSALVRVAVMVSYQSSGNGTFGAVYVNDCVQ